MSVESHSSSKMLKMLQDKKMGTKNAQEEVQALDSPQLIPSPNMKQDMKQALELALSNTKSFSPSLLD